VCGAVPDRDAIVRAAETEQRASCPSQEALSVQKKKEKLCGVEGEREEGI